MTRRAWDHGGKSRHQRGYGSQWEKLRAHVLAIEPLCRPCREAKPSRITEATAVDHIVSKAKGGTDALDNLRPICRPCHDRKTIEEQGKKRRPKRTIALDGWPMEDDQ